MQNMFQMDDEMSIAKVNFQTPNQQPNRLHLNLKKIKLNSTIAVTFCSLPWVGCELSQCVSELIQKGKKYEISWNSAKRKQISCTIAAAILIGSEMRRQSCNADFVIAAGLSTWLVRGIIGQRMEFDDAAGQSVGNTRTVSDICFCHGTRLSVQLAFLIIHKMQSNCTAGRCVGNTRSVGHVGRFQTESALDRGPQLPTDSTRRRRWQRLGRVDDRVGMLTRKVGDNTSRLYNRRLLTMVLVVDPRWWGRRGWLRKHRKIAGLRIQQFHTFFYNKKANK